MGEAIDFDKNREDYCTRHKNKQVYFVLLSFLLIFAIMKRIFLIFIYIFTILAVSAQKREVRAVWLTTIGGLDWPHSYSQSNASAEKQKQELRTILNKLQKAGVNTVLLQTRVRATTIYPSQYEPWDGCLSGFPGKTPGYDALQFAIDECHKRGMELHAWVVTIPVGKWNKLGCQSLRRKYPNLVCKIGDEGYMNPEKEQTAEYISKMCREIADNYDVDGIHLDYIRYPETWKIRINANSARKNITRIVEAVNSSVKSIKPWVKISCSPVGKASDLTRYWAHGWNARDVVMQDAQKWMSDGLMDALFPMMYFKGNNFYPFALDWQEQSNGRIIAPGLGIYFLSPKEKNWPLEDISREMYVLRKNGMGHAYFRSKFFTDDVKGIYSFAEDFDATPSLVPPMTWEKSVAPEAPKDVKFAAGRLSWQKKDGVVYNIYSSREWPVDTENASNLMLARQEVDGVAVPADANRYYAVTAMDRYGNESKAVQSNEKRILTTQMLNVCSGWIELPASFNTSGDAIIVASAEGNLIKTAYARNSKVDVSAFPAGVYQLRTLNHKGISHRIGFFAIPMH